LVIFDAGAPLPFVTHALPGIGGRIKESPEDFQVEEIPAYEPSGQGEHLYVWIEKRALGAEFFIRQVARRLGISANEIGTAGLKDRQAVSRQMISVPISVSDRLGQLDGDGIQILRVSRHTNKLRPGHLRGNRFQIMIRQVDSAAGALLPPLVAALKQNGLPNFYGPQRFGRGGETAKIGLDLLAGQLSESPEARRPRRLNPFLRKLALSAGQSALFNQYLARRVRDGLLHRVLAGDVMAKRPFGGLFVAMDVARDQARFDAREIVHTGPIFGRKTFAASAEAAERENAVLREAALTNDCFRRFGKLLQGTRRPNLVYLDDLEGKVDPEGVLLRFSLPSGSYATILLQEVMKCRVTDGVMASIDDEDERS
jgi:tRNA pseudouridine13 synthase